MSSMFRLSVMLVALAGFAACGAQSQSGGSSNSTATAPTTGLVEAVLTKEQQDALTPDAGHPGPERKAMRDS